MFAIIDIESTGGNQHGEKITEIAIYKHDGNKIIEKFTTLLNPEIIIPIFVSRLTGISDSMVANQPKFYEIANKIISITDNCVIVAHNVVFDYNFIRREFKELGYIYKRKTLCTVKLSRIILPNHTSYSLGKLCNDLNIPNLDRHRADGDALATVQLFELLLKTNPEIINEYLEKQNNGEYLISDSEIDNLPEETGIYYFEDVNSTLLFLGASSNIKEKIVQHFHDFGSERIIEMCSLINRIKYELTGSLLIAELRVNTDVYKLAPKFNKTFRRKDYNFGLFKFMDTNGYLNFYIAKINVSDNPIISFGDIESAKKEVNTWIKQFNLCVKLSGTVKNDGKCTNENCNGACVGTEKADLYNTRAVEFINYIYWPEESFVIVDKGRTIDEASVIWVDKGIYKGWNYISTKTNLTYEKLIKNIPLANDTKEIRRIIKNRMNVQKFTYIRP